MSKSSRDDKCTYMFTCVLVCVEGSTEPDIYRSKVELQVLVYRGCYSLCK